MLLKTGQYVWILINSEVSVHCMTYINRKHSARNISCKIYVDEMQSFQGIKPEMHSR